MKSERLAVGKADLGMQVSPIDTQKSFFCVQISINQSSLLPNQFSSNSSKLEGLRGLVSGNQINENGRLHKNLTMFD